MTPAPRYGNTEKLRSNPEDGLAHVVLFIFKVDSRDTCMLQKGLTDMGSVFCDRVCQRD